MDRYARLPNYTSNYLIEIKSAKIHYSNASILTIARNERHLCPQAQHLMSADSNSDMRIRDQATCDQAF